MSSATMAKKDAKSILKYMSRMQETVDMIENGSLTNFESESDYERFVQALYTLVINGNVVTGWHGDMLMTNPRVEQIHLTKPHKFWLALAKKVLTEKAMLKHVVCVRTGDKTEAYFTSPRCYLLHAHGLGETEGGLRTHFKRVIAKTSQLLYRVFVNLEPVTGPLTLDQLRDWILLPGNLETAVEKTGLTDFALYLETENCGDNWAVSVLEPNLDRFKTEVEAFLITKTKSKKRVRVE